MRVFGNHFPGSLRTKLTLMTVVAIGCLLLLTGIVVEVGARGALIQSVDQDLRAMAADEANESPHFAHSTEPPDSISIGDPQPVSVKLNAGEGFAYDPGALSAAAAGKTTIRDLSLRGLPFRVLTVPLYDDGRIAGAVQAPRDMRSVERSVADLRRTLLAAIPIGMAGALLVSVFVVGRLMQPIRLMDEKATAIGGGNLAERLPVVGSDEVSSLARTFNGMLGRIESAFSVEREANRRLAETVEIQREFTADASHELKTPLAVVKANTGLLLQVRNIQGPNREAIEIIDDAADRMGALVRDLLVLARVESGLDASKLKDEALQDVATRSIDQLPKAAGSVEIHSPGTPLIVSCIPEELVRVFVNVVGNALEHGSSVRAAELRLTAGDGFAEVVVQDFGQGIAPEHLPRLFDRFYRIDKSRSSATGGAGLGLAICRRIVEAHGGEIAAESQVGLGTRIHIRLPLSRR